MNIYYPTDYSIIYNVENFIESIASSLEFLFIILLILAIFSIFMFFRYHRKNSSLGSSSWISATIAIIQIIVTVFIINEIIINYQENQWEKTKILIKETAISDLQDDLIEIVYVMDFSNGMRQHNYIEVRLEKNQKLSKDEAIYVGKRLINYLKIDDFADHYRYKKGEDIIDYQARVVKEFSEMMETNLDELDRIINFSQIRLSIKFYTKLLECRKEYENLIKHSKGYSSFLSASEITSKLYDYNLKFEMKHKKELFESIIKTIGILIDIINMESFED